MTRARILADYVAGGTTATEFDHLDGVTSNVQTQLDAKLPLAGGTMTGNIVMGDDTSIGIADDAERIEFDGAGDISILGANLGINTTVPYSPLEIKHSGTDFLGGLLLRASNNNDTWAMVSSGGNLYTGFANDASGADAAADFTTKMIIEEGGNVGIGTSSPTSKLHVYGNGGSGGYASIIHNDTNSNGYHALMTNLNSNQGNTSNTHIRFHTGGVANWYIYGNGTHSLASDERLKKNIETTRDGYLEDLCKFRIVKYNWKNDADGTPKELGIIAQEVEQIFPNLVQNDQDTISDDDDTLYKQVKVTVLPFMMLKAIQELSAKNDALEAENTAMKTRMDALEARLTALEGE